MLSRFVVALLLLISVVYSCKAEDFMFCPEGFFATANGDITFARNQWGGNYKLFLKNDGEVSFVGPVFAGYEIAQSEKIKVDAASKSLVEKQYCDAARAHVEKRFKLINGSIVTQISYQIPTIQSKPVFFRILLPVSFFAGMRASWNGESFELPQEKIKKRILKQGKGSAELRFRIASDMELGLKFLTGVKRIRVTDCRHHTKPESCFDISFELESNSCSTQICLLRPGDPFPPTDSEIMKVLDKNGGKNLLGEGAGFEVGRRNLIPFAYPSWSESWPSPIIQPVFDSNEKFEGKTSLRLQAEDIKKIHGRFNINGVIFKKVRLDPEKTYTLSAWLKSDSDIMKATLACKEGVWNGQKGMIVNVTKNWMRYSYTFKPDHYKKLNYCTPWVGIHPGIETGKLWIDAVQLEEGKVSSYEPPDVEFSATIEKEFKLFTPEELKQGTVTLRFRNNSSKNRKEVIDYTIKNYWDKIVSEGENIIRVPSASNAQSEIKIPDLSFGYYRIFLVNGDHTLRDEVIFGVYKPLKGSRPLVWPLGGHASEGTPIVSKLGFGWTRSWDFSMKQVYPKPSHFNWDETDIVVKRCRQAGLNLMPVLGCGFGLSSSMKNGHRFIPDWAVDRIAKSSLKNSWAKAVYFPRINAWRQYVKALVTRYKDDVKVWEVLNEPNCWLTPEEYIPYLKATYEAAKEADPNCIIVGGCATSDWAGEPAPWTKRLIELDKGRHMDVLSIHMYSNIMPELYKDNGSDGFLRILKGLLKKYGRDMPIWHTEKSYNTTETGYSRWKHNTPAVYMGEQGFRVKSFREKAEFLIRETLLDYAVGGGPFFWFGNLPNHIFIKSHRTPYGLQHMEFDESPCPELLAANGLARVINGRSTPAGLLKLSATIFCSLTTGKTGTVAAVWDSAEKSTITLTSTRTKLYDFFGKEMDFETGKAININSAPVYFTFEGMNIAAVKKILKSAKISGRSFTFSGGLELEGGNVALVVYARNLTTDKHDLALSIVQYPTGWSFKTTSLSKVCSPVTSTRYFFPIRNVGTGKGISAFQLKAGVQTVIVSIPPVKSLALLRKKLIPPGCALAVLGTPVIDGNLSDWSERAWSSATSASQVKNGRINWKGPADLSCQMRFYWDQDNLYLGAVIYDDIVERNAEVERTYMSDGLEFFLGFDTTETKTIPDTHTKIGEQNFQFFFVPGIEHGKYTTAEAWSTKHKSAAGIKVKSSLFRGGYVLEASIPWMSLKKDFIPPHGLRLNMTFQVPDSDRKGGASEKKIFWTGNDGNWLNSAKWGKLRLN